MNNLIFDPKKQTIQEWKPLYFSGSQLTQIIHLIYETNMFIQFIQHQDDFEHQSRSRSKKNNDQIFGQDNQWSSDEDMTLARQKNLDSHLNHELDAIIQLRKKKKTINLPTGLLKIRSEIIIREDEEQFQNIQAREALEIPVQRCESEDLSPERKGLKMYLKKLVETKNVVVGHLTDNIEEEKRVIQVFVEIKLREIKRKFDAFLIIQHQLPKDQRISVLYSNIFIETYNLANFLSHNRQILMSFTKESPEFTGYNLSYNETEVKRIMKGTVEKMEDLLSRTHAMQSEIRDIYLQRLKPKRDRIRDSCLLQKEIVKDIAVNSEEFAPMAPSIIFVSGIVFGIVLIALIATLTVRFSSDNFQEDDYYFQKFRVWRGASYMLYTNWILTLVFYLCERFKLNYKLLLLEGDCFIPRPQSFFLSATVMTAVYLVLFGLFMANELKVINVQGLHMLGYYQWIFNIVFILNPIKIINYEGRRYYVTLFLKLILSPFRDYSFRVHLLSLYFSSQTQPFSDFSYTFCKAITASESDCNSQSRLATYVFNLFFSILRIILALKAHYLLKPQTYLTRPMNSVVNNIFVINNVTASFIYSYFLTTGTLVYWIVSAGVATISGLIAEFRSDWGLITLNQQSCLLRRDLHFPKIFYYVIMVINVILILGWVLTISDNTADGLGINMVYFLMILSYVQLARRGMWLFVRLEEVQTINSSAFRAMQTDDNIYEELQEEILKKSRNQQNAAFLQNGEDQDYDIDRDIRRLKTIVNKRQIKLAENEQIFKKLRETLNEIHETHDPTK